MYGVYQIKTQIRNSKRIQKITLQEYHTAIIEDIEIILKYL
jgi:hypothetical protein